MAPRNEFGVESNDGEGFGGFGDDSDFESMFSEASAAGEADDSGSSFLSSFGIEPDPEPESTPEQVTNELEINENNSTQEIDKNEGFVENNFEKVDENIRDWDTVDSALNETTEVSESDDSFDFASFEPVPGPINTEPEVSDTDYSTGLFDKDASFDSLLSNVMDEPGDAVKTDDFDSFDINEFAVNQSSPKVETPAVEEPAIEDIVKAAESVRSTPQPQKRPRPHRAPQTQIEPEFAVAEVVTPDPVIEEVIEAPEIVESVPSTSVIESTIESSAEAILSIDLVNKIIGTIDAIRALEDSSLKMANIYITNGNPVATNDELVLAAIQADRQLMKTCTALIDAKQQEAVDRAFSILALDDATFVEIGDLVLSSGESELPGDFKFTGDRLSYARALVDGIQKMSDESIEYIRATQSIIAASE